MLRKNSTAATVTTSRSSSIKKSPQCGNRATSAASANNRVGSIQVVPVIPRRNLAVTLIGIATTAIEYRTVATRGLTSAPFLRLLTDRSIGRMHLGDVRQMSSLCHFRWALGSFRLEGSTIELF